MSKLLECIGFTENWPNVPRLGMGCWAVGGHGWGKVDDCESIKAVRYAFEQGITLFDTADVYGLGKSESLLRQALGTHIENVFVTTKGGVRWDTSGKVWNDSSPEYLRTAVEASLKRLGLETIPLYYIHKLDNRTPIKDILSALSDLQSAGKISAIGVSNFSSNELLEALEIASVAAVQTRLNILHPENGYALQDICKRNQIKLIAWGALNDGLLTGKFGPHTKFGENDHRSRSADFQGSNLVNHIRRVEKLRPIADKYNATLSQLALRWIMDLFPWACPLFGAKTPAQVTDNMGAFGWKISKEDMIEISRIATSIF
jgi:aryl-alcohol dehydrogenase-like predicted oxidoreductase